MPWGLGSVPAGWQINLQSELSEWEAPGALPLHLSAFYLGIAAWKRLLACWRPGPADHTTRVRIDASPALQRRRPAQSAAAARRRPQQGPAKLHLWQPIPASLDS